MFKKVIIIVSLLLIIIFCLFYWFYTLKETKKYQEKSMNNIEQEEDQKDLKNKAKELGQSFDVSLLKKEDIGKIFKLEGIAENNSSGAILKSGNNIVYLKNLDKWPELVVGEKVEVNGILAKVEDWQKIYPGGNTYEIEDSEWKISE